MITQNSSFLSRWAAVLLTMFAFAFGVLPTRATDQNIDSQKKSFDVPAGDARPMLKQFAAQAGCEIVFLVESVEGVKTNPVKGEMTAREAIDGMLAGTGLAAGIDEKTGAFAVRRESSDANPQGAPRSAQSEPPTGPAAPPPSVAAAASPAPDKEEALVKLPQFDVTGAPVDRYNAAEASSAARTSSKILDTPISIYVMTAALMQDINPNVMWDVASLFPGISAGRSTGGDAELYDRFDFRGFSIFHGYEFDFSRCSGHSG